MANVTLVGINKVSANNAVATVPEGFLSASITNLGSASCTVTQNGIPFTIPAAGTFNFPVREGNLAWYGLSIDATGTQVECVYF